MADCDDRQLTDDDRAEGARQQQRVGVQRAIAPFRGRLPPGMDDLMNWLNRQLVPVLQQTRKAVNDVWRTSVDNVPGTGNPLVHFFSESTAGGDPGTGRSKLNQAAQNTATVLRFSDLNGQRADVSVFAEVIQGSVTAPLGILTLQHAANPARYIRFDLTSIVDNTTYWEATVDPIEASHPVPFVEGDPVTIAFLPGVGSDGAVVPASSLELIASDTVIGNVSGALAPPTQINLPFFAGAGLTYDLVTNHDFNVGAGDGINVNADSVEVDVTDLVDNVSITEVATNNIQRAALTGAIAAAAGSNATLFSGIRDNGSAETDRTSLNWVSSISIVSAITDDAGNDELEISHQRAALDGSVSAAQNSNTTLFASVRNNGVAASNARRYFNWIDGTNTAAVVTDDGVNNQFTIALNVDNFPLTGLADQAAETFLGNFTAGLAPPTARAGSSVAGAGLTYTAGGTLAVGAGTGITVNANDVQLTTIADDTFMANVSGGAAVATGKTFTSLGGAGIDYNATTHALDIVLTDFDSTSIVVNGTVLERAALTGAIAASQNSNATVFAGIRDNGVAENDRTNLNFLNGNGVNVAITDDAANDELEIAFSVDLTDFDSTSIVVNGTALERAALTGAIAASQNSNATLFSGIRDNGSAETDRTNLNFVNSASCTAVVTDDAGNDELEITYQRAALTGEVTASANSNSTTVTRSTDFDTSPWTGPHTFNGAVECNSGLVSSSTFTMGSVVLTGDQTTTSISGTVNAYSPGSVLVCKASVASGAVLNGIVAGTESQLLILINNSGNELLINDNSASASAGNRILLPGGADNFRLQAQGWIWFIYTTTGSASFWWAGVPLTTAAA